MPTLIDDFPANASTTARLAIGGSATGMFEEAPDADWFAVTLVAGTRYIFNLVPAGVTGYFSGFGLAVMGADGRVLVAPVLGDYATPPSTGFDPLVSGTYYLAASETSYGTLGYKLTAAMRSGADDVAANTASTATIAANGTASATFDMAGDHDWFKFHAEVGVMYQFRPQTLPGSDWLPLSAPSATAIRDASGALVQASGDRFEAAVSGDYYLDAVGLYAGAYTMVSQTFADDYSADNNTHGRLAPGATIAGAIEFDGDVDRIKVTLAGGQSYSITMTGAGDQFDVDVGDGHGVRLNYGYGYAGPSGGVTVIVAPTTSGDYYIDIAHQQTTTLRTVLPYTLTLTGAAIDLVGNTPATAAPLALGAVVKGTLETGSDVDVYKVSLAAGVTYALALPAGMPYSLVTLSGADGAGVRLVTSQDGASATFTPSQSGLYYAAIGPAAGALNAAYTLAITEPADDAGASAAGARALTLGGHADGILESGADRDWFAIALTAGSTVWFTLTSSANFSTGGQLRLFDANGALLDATAAATDFAFAATLSHLVATSGTYYIEAASLQAKAGTYTIAAAIGVPDDIGGTRATAALLTPGAALTGTIELVSDIDMFKFAVVAGQTYDIALTASQASTVTLSDAQGAPVTTLSRIAGGTGALFTATTTGTVYASVNSQFHGAAAPTYTIRETVYARDDVAGDSSSTGVLQIGAGLRGAINYPGDHDLLRVSLEAGKSYVFQLLGAGSGGDLLTSGAFFLWLRGASSYDSGAAVKAIAGGVESRFAVTPATSGDYFLDIGSNVSPIVGSYTVKAVLLSGDASAPTLVAQSHAAGAHDMALGAGPISFTFNEAITIDKVAIALKDSGGQNVILAYGAGADGPYASVTDGTLTLTPSTALLPGSYTISLPHAGVHDLAGNQYTGPETFTFTTLLPRAAGGAGNYVIAGGTGAIIDGGAGLDTVYYGGFDANYTVTRAGTTLSVVDRLSGVTDTLVNVERLTMRSWTFAYDIDGDAGQAYRLYQAAFHRTPDVIGLGFWIGQRDKGAALLDIAAGFVNSAEFTALYGAAPTDNAYIDALYANVLHRAPDAAGYAYWSAAMHNGGSRADVLMQFSESAENKAALVGVIGDHFAYIAY